MATLNGDMYIAGRRVHGADGSASPVDAATGESLNPSYGYASADDVEQAGDAAEA